MLLRGHPFELIGGTGVDALAVDVAGRVQATPGFASYLGGLALPASIGANADTVLSDVPGSAARLCA
jgi:hypothetical protein